MVDGNQLQVLGEVVMDGNKEKEKRRKTTSRPGAQTSLLNLRCDPILYTGPILIQDDIEDWFFCMSFGGSTGGQRSIDT